MKRYYIVEGDKTTVNGIVQKHSGSGSTTSWHGKVVSNIGDKVVCPACKSVGVIQAVGSRLPFGNKGYTPAMNDDICVCKCSPPPKLIHSQTVFSQETDDSSESLLAIFNDLISLIPQNSPQNLNNNFVEEGKKEYGIQFQLKDEKTQKLFSDIPYSIIYKSSGNIETGWTDAEGKTHIINAESPDEVEFQTIDASKPLPPL